MTTTEMIITVAAIYVVVSLAGYAMMMKRYPLESCGYCKGSGKNYIPFWLSVLTWTRRKAFRECPACKGSPTQDRQWFGWF